MKSSKVLEILNDSTLDGHTEIPQEENSKQSEIFPAQISDSSIPLKQEEHLDKSSDSLEIKELKCNNDNSLILPKKIVVEHFEISTQTDYEIPDLLKTEDNKGKRKTWVFCIFFSIILSYILFGKYLPSEMEKFVIPFPDIGHSPPPSSNPQQSDQPQLCIPTRSPLLINYLDSTQCSKFTSLQSITSKLEYLKTSINWQPMFEGSSIMLNYLFPIQECKFFIGISETSTYKFSLYQDYTKSLNFYKFTRFLLSPNSTCLAISEDDKSLILIDIEIFQPKVLYSKLFNFAKVSTILEFSPDAAYLFYSRDDIDKVLVYRTSTMINIIELNINDFPVISMKASKNLYHLIVEDSKNNLQIFTLHNKNYKHCCFEETTTWKMSLEFPELLDFLIDK